MSNAAVWHFAPGHPGGFEGAPRATAASDMNGSFSASRRAFENHTNPVQEAKLLLAGWVLPARGFMKTL